MSESEPKSVLDLSGFSLCFIESPGVEFICMIFQALSDDQLSTIHLFLYGHHMRVANFACDPFFPATKTAETYYDPEISSMVLDVIFKIGQLKIAFRDASFHITTDTVRRAEL